MVTLSKIAKLANVSVSTVSKAFSGSKEVNDETREHIFAIAKKNRCFTKYYNVKYPKLVLALIAPEFSSMYYSSFITQIQKRITDNNCELCVSATNFSAENEKSLIEYYLKHSKVDGIIVIGAKNDIVESYDIPIVFINPQVNSSTISTVKADFSSAISELADRIIEAKITSIGLIGEAYTKPKLDRVVSIFDQKGIKVSGDYVSVSEKRFEEGGYDAGLKLVQLSKIPQVLICAYDNMAIGAIRALNENGIRVPQDVSVVGFDNVFQAEYLSPSLTSVSAEVDELTSIALDVIMKQINGEETAQMTVIPSKLYIRESFNV